MKKSILILLILPIFAFLLIASTGFLVDMRTKETLTSLNITRVAIEQNGAVSDAPLINGVYFVQNIAAGTKLQIYFSYTPLIQGFSNSIIGVTADNPSIFETAVSSTGKETLKYTITYYIEITFSGTNGDSNIQIYDNTQKKDVGDLIRIVVR